jgi:hypothetical protein
VKPVSASYSASSCPACGLREHRLGGGAPAALPSGAEVADAAAHDLAVVPGDQSSWLDAQRAEAKALVRETQRLTNSSSLPALTRQVVCVYGISMSPSLWRSQH